MAKAAPKPPTDVALPSEQQATNRPVTIREALSSPAQLAEFKRALPGHVGVDRFVRVALTTINTDPKLQACTKDSILAGLMQAAQLGLEVSGVRGQAFLVPRNNRRANTKEATFQLGYRGMIDLAARSGITVDTDIVYANDEFEFQRGTEPKLYHRPTFGEQGPVIAYYAVAHFSDNRRSQFVIRSVHAIEAHRDKFASQRDYTTKEVTGPWVEQFDAMATKTVIRMLLDKLPTSIELRQAVVADMVGEAPETVQASYNLVTDPVGAIDTTARPDNVTAEGEITAGSAEVAAGEQSKREQPDDGPWDTDPDAGPAEPAQPIIEGTAR
jgi:recombination protein RecT